MKLSVTTLLTTVAKFSQPVPGTNEWREVEIKIDLEMPSKEELADPKFLQMGDLKILDRVLKRVYDVETDDVDADGNPLTALEVVKRNHYASGGVNRAFLEALGHDQREYQRKNSN